MTQWPGRALTGVLLCPHRTVCLGTKLGGRCHDSHIHSSAGVAVRGEEERDAIHKSPVGLRVTLSMEKWPEEEWLS